MVAGRPWQVSATPAVLVGATRRPVKVAAATNPARARMPSRYLDGTCKDMVCTSSGPIDGVQPQRARMQRTRPRPRFWVLRDRPAPRGESGPVPVTSPVGGVMLVPARLAAAAGPQLL